MLAHLLAGAYTRFCFIGLFFVGGFVLELIAPVHPVTQRDRFFNCVCGLCFLAVDLCCAVYFNSLLWTLSSHPLIPFTVSDHHRVAFAIGLAFVWLAVRDFFYYWFHRWQHSSKWLWAEHALHHSDTQMNITTSLRHHWLEMPLNTLIVTIPLQLLFRPPAITIPAAYAFFYMVGYLTHSNVRLGAGPFAKLIVSPNNHRVHHSREPEHIDKNFAQLFPMWDVLFGTYYATRAGEFPQTGLSSGEKVTSLRRALLMPFQTWAQMLTLRSRRPQPAEIEPRTYVG
jgi:sterol desaturase/sphingolipid hydroxylase (fatty acid hydroxylase superfamily)